MSPRTGRPTIEPKTSTLKVRLSENDIEKLDFLSKETNKSKSEIIRDGIDMQYKQAKK